MVDRESGATYAPRAAIDGIDGAEPPAARGAEPQPRARGAMIDFGLVDAVDAEAIGSPGERTFRLRALARLEPRLAVEGEGAAWRARARDLAAAGGPRAAPRGVGGVPAQPRRLRRASRRRVPRRPPRPRLRGGGHERVLILADDEEALERGNTPAFRMEVGRAAARALVAQSPTSSPRAGPAARSADSRSRATASTSAPAPTVTASSSRSRPTKAASRPSHEAHGAGRARAVTARPQLIGSRSAGTRHATGASQEERMAFDPRHRSRTLLDGPDRAPARLVPQVRRLTGEDLQAPLVMVAHSWIGTMPCNFSHRELAQHVMAGVRTAGGTPLESTRSRSATASRWAPRA